MRTRWKILGGCTFLVGVVGGLFIAAGAWWIYRGILVPPVQSSPSPPTPTEQSSPGTKPALPIEIEDGPVGGFQKTILDDPDLVAELEKLVTIPEIKALFDDDVAMTALEKRDYIKLMRYAIFRAAAAHPPMRDLTAAIMKRSFSNAYGKRDKKTAPTEPE